jgi:hypothetical protein
MYHSAFQFNKEFLDKTYERIRGLRAQYAHNENFASLFVNTTFFTNEQLEKIIDTAYWASQAIEEGNQIRISIVFRDREPSANIFCFDNGVPLNPRNLIKLGSALESTFSDICTCPTRDGQIEIWGLRMRSPSHLTKNLWIQVLGPGHVLIICYGRIIAALIGNQAVFVDPSNFFRTIIPKIFAHGTKSISDPLKVHRFNTLLYIAQAMRAHERGGTLLIVPEGNVWKKSIGNPVIYTGGANFLEPQFTSQPPSSIHTLGDLLSLFQEATTTKDQNFMFTRSQIIDQCNRIGRLTAIDGALVMTYDRYIHCFGAKIQGVAPLPGSTEVRVMLPVEGDQGEKITFSDLGGTRHTSAAQFAFDQPGSIAIVASQGSNVSFFTKDLSTGELLVIQKAELALMYEGISGVIWNLSQFVERP